MRITVIRFFFGPSANTNFHELLMKYYYMEHYMGHYMFITCGVADKNSFAWD